MRIAIFVDSRYRDTLSCLLVKKRLQQLRKDWDILVVSIDLWQQVMQLYRPHVVVLNHAIGYRNREIIRRAKYSVILPTEGRPNTREQEDWYVTEQDGVADLYLSWNELIADKFEKTKAVVTGCPRFDVYYDRDKIDSKIKARAKYGLDQTNKTIGVFTSFPQAKFSFQKTQFNQQDWKDLGVDKISTRSNPLEFAQNEYAERRKFMNAISVLHDVYPQYQILVKPHPMEDIIQIQQWCDENGFTCVTQDTIFNTIAACDAVVNRIGCVTTLDAWLSNVPVVSFGTPEDDGLAAESNTVCYDALELLEAFQVDYPEIDHDYIRLCGLDDVATERVARAIVDNVPVFSDVLETKSRVMLQKVIQEHGWHNTTLDLNSGQVGKIVTIGYINSWESVL